VPAGGGILDRGLRRDWIDDGELLVEVMAEQPRQALAFVEFNAQPLGFLAGRRLHD
jgi:hypothetical protein